MKTISVLLVVLAVIGTFCVIARAGAPVLKDAPNVGTTEPFKAAYPGSERGDIIFQTGGGEEVLRFKPGGKVIANPKLKPDDAARAVLSAMYRLAPQYFCRNPDDPAEKHP